MGANNEALTIQDLMQSLEKIQSSLQLPETEESWEHIFNSLETLRKLCQAGACDYVEELTASIRLVHRNIISAMNSERTRLSGAAIDAVNALTLGLSMSFEPLMSLFLPALILLCGRANKVVVARAKACILAIIGTTQLPGILLHLSHFVKDKTSTIRLLVAEGTLQCLKCFNPPDLEKEVYAREVENIIRNAARDANADVRRVGKEIFENYKVLLPHKVNSFTAPLTPTIRKCLQLGAKPAQVQGKAPATTFSKEKVPVMMLPKAKPAARPAIRPVIVKSESNVGPVRRPKTASTTNVPKNTLSRKAPVPLHPIQLTTKATNGPQRVIRSTTTAAVPKTLGPSRSSSSSTVQQTVKKQASSSDGVRANAASRDLTRPTLSQLARVKPPVVARPPSKLVSGLNIRKLKSSSELVANVHVRGQTSRVVKPPNGGADGASLKRPRTPASIPLPPSPALTSSANLPDVEADAGSGTVSHEPAHRGESAGTPVASDRIVSADMACKTPISTLLSSIQQGFDLTPCSPLSPPEHYVSTVDTAYGSGEFRLGVISGPTASIITQ